MKRIRKEEIMRASSHHHFLRIEGPRLYKQFDYGGSTFNLFGEYHLKMQFGKSHGKKYVANEIASLVDYCERNAVKLDVFIENPYATDNALLDRLKQNGREIVNYHMDDVTKGIIESFSKEWNDTHPNEFFFDTLDPEKKKAFLQSLNVRLHYVDIRTAYGPDITFDDVFEPMAEFKHAALHGRGFEITPFGAWDASHKIFKHVRDVSGLSMDKSLEFELTVFISYTTWSISNAVVLFVAFVGTTFNVEKNFNELHELAENYVISELQSRYAPRRRASKVPRTTAPSPPIFSFEGEEGEEDVPRGQFFTKEFVKKQLNLSLVWKYVSNVMFESFKQMVVSDPAYLDPVHASKLRIEEYSTTHVIANVIRKCDSDVKNVLKDFYVKLFGDASDKMTTFIDALNLGEKTTVSPWLTIRMIKKVLTEDLTDFSGYYMDAYALASMFYVSKTRSSTILTYTGAWHTENYYDFFDYMSRKPSIRNVVTLLHEDAYSKKYGTRSQKKSIRNATYWPNVNQKRIYDAKILYESMIDDWKSSVGLEDVVSKFSIRTIEDEEHMYGNDKSGDESASPSGNEESEEEEEREDNEERRIKREDDARPEATYDVSINTDMGFKALMLYKYASSKKNISSKSNGASDVTGKIKPEESEESSDNGDVRYLFRPCDRCGVKESEFMCSRCSVARYCSVTCQRADWKRGHKKRCVTFDLF